ncbi:hypothetical protein CASFOL_035587 [Castilleja foliolosa]|uniref:BHLH domain-containing protein n=1 Tax=Castilleja foliolosa TaxID=1961234 RepID=A0ABD3BTA6_9LAMI
MAESSSISNPSPKRRKIEPKSTFGDIGRPKWLNESEQQIYSSKLVDALRHIRRPDSAVATGRAVRDAADRVLAVSAKGKTRWSRAILAGRLSLRLARINRKHKKAAKPAAQTKNSAVQRKNLPPVQKKVKVLSRLVPGCRKLALPNLLEETTDYIAALEMQVKSLTFLTGLLNGGSGGDSSIAPIY